MFLQPTNARQRPSTIRHRHGDHNLISARRIAHPRFDGIKMTAHERRVFMSERHVDGRSERTHFFRRGHQRRAFFNRTAQRRAELGMQDRRGVLQLAGRADDGGFAVAFYLVRRDAKGSHAALTEQAA